MTSRRQRINETLNQIFRDIFDDDEINIHDDMTADDIDGWDSLMHITIVVSVEKKFGIRVNAAEVGRLANVGALINLILERSETVQRT